MTATTDNTVYLPGNFQDTLAASTFGATAKPKAASLAREKVLDADPKPHGANGSRCAVQLTKPQAQALFKWAVEQRDLRTPAERRTSGLRRGVGHLAEYLGVDNPAAPSARGPQVDPAKAAAVVEAEATIAAGDAGDLDFGSDAVQDALEVVASAS